jgi:hypothetical protein
MASVSDGDLITDRSSHEIYVVEDGKRRWLPDAWTMHAMGLSPDQLKVLDDDALDDLPLGDPHPSQIPAPKLNEGTVVETANGVFEVINQRFIPVIDPFELTLREGFDAKSVVFLPPSIIRSAVTGPPLSGKE